MPPRSSVFKLPDDIRRELNRELVARGFQDYSGLEAWLSEKLEQRGLEVRLSRSAIARHGKEFEEKLEAMRLATEQAKAIAEGADDDEGAMNEALIRLVQTKMFRVLMDVESDADVGKIGVAIARLARASVTQKKWAEEARERANKKLAALEKEAGKTGTLDMDTLRRVREEVYGIYDS